jgi:hypothetical protein
MAAHTDELLNCCKLFQLLKRQSEKITRFPNYMDYLIKDESEMSLLTVPSIYVIKMVACMIAEHLEGDLKCEEWGCKYLAYGGLLTTRELTKFAQMSRCRAFANETIEGLPISSNPNIIRRRKTLYNRSLRSLIPSIIYIAKTGKPLDGPLSNPVNLEISHQWYVNRMYDITDARKHIRRVNYKNGPLTYKIAIIDNVRYEKEHAEYIKLACVNLQLLVKQNPWLTSEELSVYAVKRAFDTADVNGKLSFDKHDLSFGYEKVAEKIKHGGILNAFDMMDNVAAFDYDTIFNCLIDWCSTISQT